MYINRFLTIWKLDNDYFPRINPIPEKRKKRPYKIPRRSEENVPAIRNKTPKIKKVKIAVHSAEGPLSD